QVRRERMAEGGADGAVEGLFATVRGVRVAEVDGGSDGRRAVALWNEVFGVPGAVVVADRTVERDPVGREIVRRVAAQEPIRELVIELVFLVVDEAALTVTRRTRRGTKADEDRAAQG